MSEYRRISIKKELLDSVERYIYRNPDHGYRSLAEFIEDAIRRRGEELGLFKEEEARFEHFNCYEDHVTLWDKKFKRLVDVYFAPKPPYILCSICQASDCEHAQFALSIPDVLKALREKGWKIEGGRILYVPP
ncbi:MAG: hypothetical protein QXD04_02990 [Candidatus Bathyarchaeia archaeon]